MKKKFGGVLDIPMEPRILGLLTSDEVKKKRAKWVEEDFAKLRLLCKHYGIQESVSMYVQLSLALAQEVVPAFKEKVKRGRKTKWDDFAKGCLVVEIERLIKPNSRAHGPKWAATQLAKREPWKSFIKANEADATTPNPAEVLRKNYEEFKNHWLAKVMRDAFGWHEHEGTVAEWDRELAERLNGRPQKSSGVNK